MVQRDVPIHRDWIGSLDGVVNADNEIQGTYQVGVVGADGTSPKVLGVC